MGIHPFWDHFAHIRPSSPMWQMTRDVKPFIGSTCDPLSPVQTTNKGDQRPSKMPPRNEKLTPCCSSSCNYKWMRMHACMRKDLWTACLYRSTYTHILLLIEGSLEVKLPTIWADEKQSRAEAERRGRLEERRSEEKESEERRCRCAKR